MPWSAKAVCALVAGYALSPIDLIPDFIPVLGYLDDLVIVPLGIALAVRLVPAAVLAELREEAERRDRPRALLAAGVVIALWVAAGMAAFILLRPVIVA